jgi:sugar lactone lactonase YvrE
MAAIETLVEGLDHPEGVAYDARAGIVWAGGEDGQLYRVDLEERRWQEVARTRGFVGGLAVDAHGRLAICCADQKSLSALVDGEVRGVVTERLTRPNYPAFAPDGTLYFSDSGDWGRGGGLIWRVDRDGAADVFSSARPDFPNGLAVSADARWLWLVESYEPWLSRFDLETGDHEQILRLDGTVPDGLAITGDGGLLISCYRPDRIYHLSPGGALEIVADDPQGTILSAPTNVCFVGERLDRVVSANLGRWHLTLLDLGLTGTLPHAPERWAVDALSPCPGVEA